MEQSLKIHKHTLHSVMGDKDLDREMQRAIDAFAQENEELLEKIKNYTEDQQAANTKILILEQINQEIRSKEEETSKIYLDQILTLKQQVE